MCDGANRLMLDGVHLLERVIQDTRGINGLEPQPNQLLAWTSSRRNGVCVHLVVEVPYEQGLGCEGVGLDIDIGPGDVLEEAGLANIGVTADDQCASLVNGELGSLQDDGEAYVRVNCGQTAQMLSDLLKINKRILEPLADSCHATQAGALELFALEQTLAILDQAHVVAGNSLDERLCGVELTESDAEMTAQPLSIPPDYPDIATYSAS